LHQGIAPRFAATGTNAAWLPLDCPSARISQAK
jgi:hypothetical protein